MSGWQILGTVIIAAFLFGLVALTAQIEGWRVSLVIWGASFLATGVAVLGVCLAAGVLP